MSKVFLTILTVLMVGLMVAVAVLVYLDQPVFAGISLALATLTMAVMIAHEENPHK